MGTHTSRQRARVRSMVGMIVALLLMAGVAFAGHRQTTNRKIVVLRDGTTPQAHKEIVERHGAKVLHHLGSLNGVTIELPNDKVETALAALRGDARVVAVHKDHRVSADHVVSMTPEPAPSEEIFPWGVKRIGVPVVFNRVASGSRSTPTVAILDTGIDSTHPELVQKIIGGHNARAGEEPSDYQDYNGHGTHMAGIIAAPKNRQGIIGTATHPQLVAVKVLDASGHGYLSDLISGLEWVLDHNDLVSSEQRISIVNMSLSFSEGSPLLEQVIMELYSTGVTMVASAGNRCPGNDEGTDDEGGDSLCDCGGGSEDEGADDEGGDSGCGSTGTNVRYPAAYPEVIAVVATYVEDNKDKLTDYNRSGDEVDLAAPGGSRCKAPCESEQRGEILSTTLNGGFGLGTGSSQAAAHVAGAAAVALQVAPWLSVNEVVAHLKETAKNLGYKPEHQGAGLVAVDALVKRLIGLQ